MNQNRLDLRAHHSGSTQSEESALDLERSYYDHLNPSSSPSHLQPFAGGAQHSESTAAYFSWPTLSRWNDAAEDRANYFGNLQKGVLPETLGRLPTGQQATTLLELMTIRAFHSKILRRFSLGTAIGFRIRGGVLTDIPAILVFIAHKVHRQWLNHVQCLPAALEGPGGVWCDVDVVEFSYYGAPAQTSKEQLYTELADGLRGSDSCVGSGSQVASQETYGTLGAIVKSRTGNREVGFLTNRHVAVDLDYPNQKMFHPLPPSLGPGVYLGAVERATSFITDDLWYGIFAGTNPETFVRADGAFIPFAEDFNMNNVITTVKGVGEIGDVNIIDLQSPINSLIGRQVVKVGRSSGLTTGTIMAYALEYNDEKGICFLTDFLVVGENQQTFDLEGDSGSLILLTGQNGEKPRPVGIIWGGTANRGRLKLKVGQPPENWTSGVDLGRLLDLLELDLITTNEALQGLMAGNPKARAYFSQLYSKRGGSTPRPEREVEHEVEVEVVEPFSRVEAVIEIGNPENVNAGPSKRRRKGDRSGIRSHLSSKRHHHVVGSSSRVLPETIFTTSTHFSDFVQANLDEPSCDMLKTSNIPSLADSIVELASRALLIGKVIKEESANGVSPSEFEKLKRELAELSKNLELAFEANSSLTTQVKELSKTNTQHEAERELLKDEIAGLTTGRLKLVDENNQLKKGLFDLSSVKQADVEKIRYLENEISQLKKNVSIAEGYVVEQHKLGFSKALQQAKNFYKIPLDEGNFDVGKDFYNDELIPVEDIPYDEMPEEDAACDEHVNEE